LRPNGAYFQQSWLRKNERRLALPFPRGRSKASHLASLHPRQAGDLSFSLRKEKTMSFENRAAFTAASMIVRNERAIRIFNRTGGTLLVGAGIATVAMRSGSRGASASRIDRHSVIS
jgi:hypothetical protein